MPVTAALPISERIAAVLFERLQLLTAGLSDYSKVYEVVRPTRLGGFTPRHLQIMLTAGDKQRVPELDYPGNPPANAYQQTWNIRCHVMPSEKDPTPIDTYIETIAADVVRAVCGTDEYWHTFNDLAIDATWESHEAVQADGGLDGVNVPIAVLYRVAENDPFNPRE